VSIFYLVDADLPVLLEVALGDFSKMLAADDSS